MRIGGLGLFAATLCLVASTASASPLLMWQFSGDLKSSSTFAELYPVGTPFTLRVTFDPAAPNLTETLYPGVPEGMYRAIAGATLQLGNYAATQSAGGYIVVNCDWYAGCLSRPLGIGIVWFEMFGPWLGPPLHPACPNCQISRIGVDYFDPDHAADGQIPTTTPSSRARLEFNVGDWTNVFAIGSADVRSVQDIPAVPEPSTFVLLGSGLAGLYARRKRHLVT